MAKLLTSQLLEGQWTFSATGEQYTYWPNPIKDIKAQPITPPGLQAPAASFDGRGYVRSVMVRVDTGSGVTLTDLQVGLYRDLDTFADGTIVAPGFTLANIPDDRKVYVSSVIATPTPSAVTADIDDRISDIEPFARGLWIVSTATVSAGSGDTTVSYRIWLDVSTDY